MKGQAGSTVILSIFQNICKKDILNGMFYKHFDLPVLHIHIKKYKNGMNGFDVNFEFMQILTFQENRIKG